MTVLRSRTRWGLVALAASAALVAACSGPSASSGTSSSSSSSSSAAANTGSANLTFAVVTHGGAGDAFWTVVKNGAEAAGKAEGVKVLYDSNGDPAQQSKLIDNYVAQKVNGLVVSMANPDALQTSIKAAVAAGIPVITINSGQDKSAAFGAIAHVGQDEAIAGAGAGSKLKAAGRTHLLCVIHEAGNIGLNQRCDGAKSTFGNVTNLQVDLNNPTDVQTKIKGALQADPSIDSVLALNGQVAALAVQAAKDANSKAAGAIATFDLNSDVVTAIQNGGILFAVDQQQYLQGYLPIVMLKLYVTNGNVVGGGKPVLTGPGFVDKSNVDAVAKYAAAGTR
jgi:simple sugar transport system substrate-binding protein